MNVIEEEEDEKMKTILKGKKKRVTLNEREK